MTKYFIQLTLVFLSFSCIDNEEVNYNYDTDSAATFFSVGAGNWQFDENTNAWFYTFDTNLIDENTVNNGAVLVYVADLESTANRWRALPRTEIYYNEDPENGEIGDFDYSIEWGFWYGPGYLELELYHSNPPEIFPDFNADFKLFVLDEFQYQSLIENNIDTDNYLEVKNFFKLD